MRDITVDEVVNAVTMLLTSVGAIHSGAANGIGLKSRNVADHRHTVDSFITLLSSRQEMLKLDDGLRSAFEKEMRRFLPSNLVAETIENKSFWPYVTNLVTAECDQVIGLLSGNVINPTFRM